MADLEFLATLLAWIALYLAPTAIATRSPEQREIFLFNLVAGWTVLGWFIALVWALTADHD